VGLGIGVLFLVHSSGKRLSELRQQRADSPYVKPSSAVSVYYETDNARLSNQRGRKSALPCESNRRTSTQAELFSRACLGNRGGPFCDWLVHAVAKSALVVEPAHCVTLDALARLTRVGFAKRARNLKPRFSHAPNVVLPRSHVYTRSKQSLGASPDFSAARPRASYCVRRYFWTR
jgi:hypothetical protein